MKQKLSLVVSSNGALDLTGLKPSERALALGGAAAPPIEAFFMPDPAATPKPIPPPLNMHTPPSPSSLLRRLTDHTGELASMTHANVLDLHQLQALTPWDHDAHPIPPVPRRSDTASQTTFNEYKAAVLQDRHTAELAAYGAAVQAHTQANRAASEAYVAAHTAFVADFDVWASPQVHIRRPTRAWRAATAAKLPADFNRVTTVAALSARVADLSSVHPTEPTSLAWLPDILLSALDQIYNADLNACKVLAIASGRSITSASTHSDLTRELINVEPDILERVTGIRLLSPALMFILVKPNIASASNHNSAYILKRCAEGALVEISTLNAEMTWNADTFESFASTATTVARQIGVDLTEDQILIFLFNHTNGPLAGSKYLSAATISSFSSIVGTIKAWLTSGGGTSAMPDYNEFISALSLEALRCKRINDAASTAAPVLFCAPEIHTHNVPAVVWPAPAAPTQPAAHGAAPTSFAPKTRYPPEERPRGGRGRSRSREERTNRQSELPCIDQNFRSDHTCQNNGGRRRDGVLTQCPYSHQQV